MTIKDIAQLSGYAVGTVSRVLNDRPNVSDAARQRVLAVVEEHHFKRNSNAKHLKQQSSSGVAIIIKGSRNMLFADIVEHIQALLRDSGYPSTVYYLDEDHDEVEQARQVCRERRPQGILFLGSNLELFRAAFQPVRVPCVLVTNSAAGLGFANLSSVSTDDRAGADCAVDYLLRCGHRNIAMLGGSLDISDTSARRYEGFLDAFRRQGLEFDAQRFYYAGRFSYENGYTGMQTILKRAPEVTAVFAMADVIAIGAMRALADAGLRVPEDVSIIGYDGLKIGSFYTPKLTTIAQHVELLARRGFDILMRCMEQGAPARHVTVPFTLSVRESVRNITE